MRGSFGEFHSQHDHRTTWGELFLLFYYLSFIASRSNLTLKSWDPQNVNHVFVSNEFGKLWTTQRLNLFLEMMNKRLNYFLKTVKTNFIIIM